jgi:DnaJ-class molecular chaperone
MNHYETLGMERNASQAEIKAAARKLRARHHPDRGGRHDKMAEINKAAMILLRPEKREKYDRGEADTPEQSVESRARGLLCALMQQIITQAPDDCDFIQVIMQNLIVKIGQVQELVKALPKDRKKLAKRRKRIKGGKLFDSIFDDLERALNAAEQQHKDNIESAQKALEMLKGYKDSGDADRPPPVQLLGIESVLAHLMQQAD